MTKEEIEKQADIVFPNANVVNHDAIEHQGFVKGALWMQEFYESNRLAHCQGMTKEDADREMNYAISFIEKYNRAPTLSDCVEYMITKACHTFCKFCPHQCEGYPHNDCQVLIEYRKVMKGE